MSVIQGLDVTSTIQAITTLQTIKQIARVVPSTGMMKSPHYSLQTNSHFPIT